MLKRYLFVGLLATVFVLAGCGQQTPTPQPYAQFNIEDVRNAFSQAGLPVQSMVRDMTAGRDAPLTFNDRYTFAIDRIAPDGGQVLFFTSDAQMQEWLSFISRLRADSETRRDVVYVYTNGNVLMQLNANLLPAEAQAFEAALNSIN